MTFARDREVIISRGQLVEIGGGFRIPDVMRQSGATLVEVGTTNRTYIRDYEAAITEATAALMRVHRSNFRLMGFTHEPSLADMVALADDRGLLLFDDLGSGTLLDTVALWPGPRADHPGECRGGCLAGLVQRRQATGRPPGWHHPGPRRPDRRA